MREVKEGRKEGKEESKLRKEGRNESENKNMCSTTLCISVIAYMSL